MSKIMDLKDAIAKYVESGDHISFGGFTTNRKPYAAVYEILRQGQKDFVVEAGPAGGDWDMLIGEGRVKVYNNCYTANSGYTNVSRRFRKAIEQGELIYEDYSQDAMMMMLHAAAMGLPYLPVTLMLGSDLVDKWGISKEDRAKLDKVPNEKLIVMDNPFNPEQKVCALPVPRIDTAIIHVQKAAPDGTCSIEGDEFHDVDIAVAARKTIVTAEEIVSNEEIRKHPEKNSLPAFCVDAVVHTPYGAHPSQCLNYYDYDKEFMIMYDKVSKTDEDFKAYMDEWVYGVKSHEEYIEKLGANRLLRYRETRGFGYAKEIK